VLGDHEGVWVRGTGLPQARVGSSRRRRSDVVGKVVGGGRVVNTRLLRHDGHLEF